MLNKKLVALAIILSMLAAGSVYWYLSEAARRMDNTEYASVLITTQDIAKNTIITKEMLKETAVPKQYVETGAATSSKEVVGKVSLTKIFQGQQILRQAVVREGDTKEGLAYTIPVGKRAVSIAIDKVSGIDGMIMPGDRVDVAATMDFKAGEKEISQTSVIIQDVQVLAVGRVLEAEGQSWLDREDTEETLTLAVLPKEAQPLILASEKGSVRLMLRSPGDSGKSNLGALQSTDMMRRR